MEISITLSPSIRMDVDYNQEYPPIKLLLLMRKLYRLYSLLEHQLPV